MAKRSLQNLQALRKQETPKNGKVHTVMSEFKHKTLHSGSSKGPKVTSRKQAVAIALSEARKHAS